MLLGALFDELLSLDRLLLTSFTYVPKVPSCAVTGNNLPHGILAVWEIETHNEKGHAIRSIIKIGMKNSGERLVSLERLADDLFQKQSKKAKGNIDQLPLAETLLEREIKHRGQAKNDQAYSSKLIGWVEVV